MCIGASTFEQCDTVIVIHIAAQKANFRKRVHCSMAGMSLGYSNSYWRKLVS